MTSVQQSYEKNIRSALAGLVADVGPYEIASRSNKTPGGLIIPFGAVVGIDAGGDDGCVLGLGAGYLGIATRRAAKEHSAVSADSKEYLADETVGVFRSGKIWVYIQNAGGLPGISLYFDDVTGLVSSGTAGAGETDIANATLDMAVPGAGELALIRIGA